MGIWLLLPVYQQLSSHPHRGSGMGVLGGFLMLLVAGRRLLPPTFFSDTWLLYW